MASRPSRRARVAITAALTASLLAVSVAVAATLGGVNSNTIDTQAVPGTPQTPANWTRIRGTATITTTAVTMGASGENRVINSAGGNTNLSFTTTASIPSGNGYGMWIRGTFNTGSGQVNSAYSFQADPGFGGVFIIRQWRNDAECNPIASTPFYPGYNPTVPHRVNVTTSGNTLTVTVDGTTVINIPSLTAAIAAGSCPTWPAPTGVRYGFRTWAGAATFTNTIIVP
jgi:hypothetical protein